MMEFTAPRFKKGERLGRFPVEIVTPFLPSEVSPRALLVRFADGHMAAVFEYELRGQGRKDNEKEDRRMDEDQKLEAQDDARYDEHAKLHGRLIDHVAKALEAHPDMRALAEFTWSLPGWRSTRSATGELASARVATRLAIAALEAIDEFESNVAAEKEAHMPNCEAHRRQQRRDAVTSHSTTVLVVKNRVPTAEELASALVVIRVDPVPAPGTVAVLKDNLGGNAVRVES